MSRAPRPYLPGILRTIADEVSEEAAVKLAQSRGGRTVWVPQTPKQNSALTLIVGLDAARGISRLFGDSDLEVPQGSLRGPKARHAIVRDLAAQGLSKAQIADRVDLTTRTVRTILNDAAPDARDSAGQLPLPFED